MSSERSVFSAEPVDDDFSEVTEKLAWGAAVLPHMKMPPGAYAMCTYVSERHGAEPRTEVVRPGQIVPQTLLGGWYEFSRGVLFRLT